MFPSTFVVMFLSHVTIDKVRIINCEYTSGGGGGGGGEALSWSADARGLNDLGSVSPA